VLMEAYMMKFHPLHREAKRIIEAGELGKLVMLRGQFSGWYPPIEGAWRQKWCTGGGGTLIDMASHVFDLLWWFAGPITEVGAMAGNLVHGYETEDSSLAMVRFASGAYGAVESFWNIPEECVPNLLEIYGTRGSLIASGTLGQAASGEMVLRRKGEVRKIEPAEKGVNMYLAEMDYFRRCVEAGVPPEINSGPDGVRIMRVIEAAYESARTGQRIGVQD